MGWPIVGHTLSFLKPHRSTSIGNFLQDQCSRYGKVFKSHLFGSPTIVSCDYELNMYILQNEEKLFPASYPKAMKGILGSLSVLMVSGELHRKLRGIVVNFNAISKSNPTFLHSLEKLSISMMDSWKDCKEIEFHKHAKKLTLDLMLITLMSIEAEDALGVKIFEDYRTFMKGFVSLPIEVPGSHYWKAVKARERLSRTVKEIIQQRRINNNNNNRKEDFLQVILSKGQLSDDEIVSIMLDILLAGYETTSTLISLILYFVAHSPLAFQSLRTEHESIRLSKSQQYLDFEDYHKMDFTHCVINEALRCGNTVKLLHRKAAQDVKFKEYVIPSGWTVLPILAAAHLDPSIHENPFDFNPWRWSTADHNKGTTNSKKVMLMPFGGGPRLCPGAELAKVETAFFLHHLVLNYRWKVKADDCPMAYPYVEFRRGLLLEIEATNSA
ncbi:Cytochrome P450 724B1 [Euphorbia peplus]|nr:Cytochrome P450 724B1 [Euphorbia peplus]